MNDPRSKVAVFGGGCFWCTEAVFDELRGVESVMSGYAGGSTNNPTYEEVCGGRTGHAEVVRVTFDPNVIKSRTASFTVKLNSKPTASVTMPTDSSR